VSWTGLIPGLLVLLYGMPVRAQKVVVLTRSYDVGEALSSARHHSTIT
jgi:hypothetical protein